MSKKINANTKISLTKKSFLGKYKTVRTDYFSGIVKYLLNNGLIFIDNEYLIPMKENGKEWIKRDYQKIFKNFKDIAHKDYKIEIYEEKDDDYMTEGDYQSWGRL